MARCEISCRLITVSAVGTRTSPPFGLCAKCQSPASAELRHAPRTSLVEFLRPGDLVVANDAMTLPASLHGVHIATGAPVEMRLAGLQAPAEGDLRKSIAVVLGTGDYRTRTEDRPAPPPLSAGDRLAFGDLRARIIRKLGHPRLVAVAFDGSAEALWRGLARHGRPIQYAHVPQPLALWDAWTSIAAVPVAFEPPSAGFVIDWALVAALSRRGIGFATLTHAAGISSTGDRELDRRLPLDEAYRIPDATARAIVNTRRAGGRIVAIGTTVVRALEHAAARHDGDPCAAAASCARATASPTSASARPQRFASSTRSSRACTSRAAAITICCGRSRTTRRCAGRRSR